MENNICGLSALPPIGRPENPRSVSQTELAIQEQGETIKMLHDAISLLETKLQPIMRGPEPEDCSESKEESSLVPLAGKLKDHNRAIRNAAVLIRKCHDRLEI